MKKQLSLLLAALMLTATLASCGGDEGTTTDTNADTTAAGTETAAETEAVTTEEVTTEPVETEPPMVEVFTPVYEENFDSADANWKQNAQLKDFKIEGGFMSAVSTGGDPSFCNKTDFDLDCSTINAIKIKYLNCTASDAFQIFFTTDSIAGYNETDSYRDMAWYTESAEDSDEWNEMVIYTEDAAGWTGTLKDMRIDITNGEGKFIVDYIAFGTITMEPAQ
ncbi:MAG: hypothetical protein E7604_11750 [Ruminococcaceae bacterium]|nr:hypothetical protein [Oscillospiraceae bacterium]